MEESKRFFDKQDAQNRAYEAMSPAQREDQMRVGQAMGGMSNAQARQLQGMPPPAVLKPGGVPLPLPPGGTGAMGGGMGGMGGAPAAPMAPQFKKGGSVKAYAKGGMVSKPSSASSRGDGIAQRGKTKGRIV
jgi:hypothetical protein